MTTTTFTPAMIRDFMKHHYRHFNAATVVDAAPSNFTMAQY